MINNLAEDKGLREPSVLKGTRWVLGRVWGSNFPFLSDNTGGNYEKLHLYGKKIASIHNHPNGYYSFPSPNNFDILENNFEDYEIITSVNFFWIVEFKGIIDNFSRRSFQQSIGEDMNEILFNIRLNYHTDEIDEVTEYVMGNYLINELNNQFHAMGLNLIKRKYVNVK